MPTEVLFILVMVPTQYEARNVRDVFRGISGEPQRPTMTFCGGRSKL